MPTRRTAKRRSVKRHINQAAIDAWKRCDYLGLHAALNLAPFQRSPLPLAITSLGCDQEEQPTGDGLWNESWKQAAELQRQLLETAGEPDVDAVRAHYQENLAEAEKYLHYKLTKPPGPHDDKELHKRDTERARQEVAWRKELLDSLN